MRSFLDEKLGIKFIDEFQKNEALKGIELNEDQKKAITQLYFNLEDKVIAKKTRILFDGMDDDLYDVFGERKRTDEKTYEFLKRKSKELKDDASSAPQLRKDLESEKSKVKALEKQIQDGDGDKGLKAQLKASQDKVSTLENQVTKLKEDKATMETNHAKALAERDSDMNGVRLDSVLAKAGQGKKFKDSYTEDDIRAFEQSARQAVNRKGDLVWIDGENGTKTAIYKDESGATITNPNNNHNPLTPQDVYSEYMSSRWLEAEGAGGGGGNGSGGGDFKGEFRVKAKTKHEANMEIDAYMRKTYPDEYGTPDYQEKYDAIYEENKVHEMDFAE